MFNIVGVYATANKKSINKSKIYQEHEGRYLSFSTQAGFAYQLHDYFQLFCME